MFVFYTMAMSLLIEFHYQFLLPTKKKSRACQELQKEEKKSAHLPYHVCIIPRFLTLLRQKRKMPPFIHFCAPPSKPTWWIYRSSRRDGGSTPFGLSTGAAGANAFEGHGNPGHSSSLGENGEELPRRAAGGSPGVPAVPAAFAVDVVPAAAAVAADVADVVPAAAAAAAGAVAAAVVDIVAVAAAVADVVVAAVAIAAVAAVDAVGGGSIVIGGILSRFRFEARPCPPPFPPFSSSSPVVFPSRPPPSPPPVPRPPQSS